MSGTTTNNPETLPESTSKSALPSVGAEDFDPLREIRRLRQDLAHRLELLQSVESVESKDLIEKVISESPKNDSLNIEDSRSEIVERAEIVVVSSTEPIEEQESEDATVQLSGRSENIERFVDRLHQTEHLLSRLRHPLFEKEELFVDRAERQSQENADPVPPPTVVEVVSSPPPSPPPVDPEPTVMKEVATEDPTSGWFSSLKKINTALVLLGFFGAILGVLYYSRGEVRDVRIGLPLAIAGLMLIVIGIAGRLIQNHLNRRADRRGKLTSAP